MLTIEQLKTAHANGAVIQFKSDQDSDSWSTINCPSFDDKPRRYRIKPTTESKAMNTHYTITPVANGFIVVDMEGKTHVATNFNRYKDANLADLLESLEAARLQILAVQALQPEQSV